MDLEEIIRHNKSLAAEKLSEEIDISPTDLINLFEEPRDRAYGYMALPCYKISPGNPKDFAEKWADEFNNIIPITSTTVAKPVGAFVNFKLKPECKVEYRIKSVLEKICNKEKIYL